MDSIMIGRRLRKLRGERSRGIVAKAIGISISALGMYETGDRIPKDEIKIKLANYYGQSVEVIFFAGQCHEM